MNVVVTGGGGFIGSHVVDALIAEGAVVHVVDDFSSGRLENLEWALERGTHLHVADVADAEAMTALMNAVAPDVVLHLAAQIDVRRSMAAPAFDARANVTGTVAVIEAARRCGARRFVLASTAAVYGDPPAVPTPESTPPAPISAYGAGKAAAELYLDLYARRHGLSTVALRMANVHGPRQDPDGEAGVVTIFRRAAALEASVTIYGDGRQTRDYVHVEDVARAFTAAAQADVQGAVNVSTGRETTVLAVAEAFGVPIEFAPERPGEIRRSCLDPSAALRTLGWRACSGLSDGLHGETDAVAVG
jgi:UDP-glucose 4-epimerase